MIIKKDEAKEKVNNKTCTVWEYAFPSKQLGFATVKINGRYPDSGRVVNEECDELYYVLSGKGIIHHETGDYEIKEGDAFFFEKGKWYWVEGELHIAVPTSPTWFLEQHKHVD